VKLGHVEFSLNFAVLQMQEHLLLLGLDQMRYYKCLVDLERSCLVFGGHGGVEVPFLTTVTGVISSSLDVVSDQARRTAERLEHRNSEVARLALGTLGVVFRNIAKHPFDLKYRRLRGSNERLKREVLTHPEAVEILQLVGFGNDGEDFVLPLGTPLKALLKLVTPGGLLM